MGGRFHVLAKVNNRTIRDFFLVPSGITPSFTYGRNELIIGRRGLWTISVNSLLDQKTGPVLGTN